MYSMITIVIETNIKKCSNSFSIVQYIVTVMVLNVAKYKCYYF